MTYSDETLIAYADGELPPAEAAVLEAAARQDAVLAARIDAHRALGRAVTGAYAPAADEPVPPALLAMLDPKVSVLRKRAPLGGVAAWAAMAACLVLGLAVGALTPRGLVSPGMTARGALAAALQSELAANPANGAVRIGVSFQDREGQYCRSFTTGDLAGLACRENEGWRVPVLARHVAQADTPFRTASSLPPAIAAAIDERIAGEPLDEAHEAEAKARDWRAFQGRDRLPSGI